MLRGRERRKSQWEKEYESGEEIGKIGWVGEMGEEESEGGVETVRRGRDRWRGQIV